MTSATKSDLQVFENVIRNYDTRPNPPAMDTIFTDSYETKLLSAIKTALASGVPQEAVFSKVRNLCVDCMGYMDSPFIKACGSMPSDTPVDNGTSTYFHSMMNTSYPGALGELDPDYDGDQCDAREEGLLTLYTLLQDATPNKQDQDGNSVLHILVSGFVQGTYWPDDTNPGLVFHLDCPSDMHRVDERAEYTLPAFKAMIDRGWSTKVMNSDGLNVRKLIEVGVEHQKKSANKLKKSKGWLMKVAMKHVKAHFSLG